MGPCGQFVAPTQVLKWNSVGCPLERSDPSLSRGRACYQGRICWNSIHDWAVGPRASLVDRGIVLCPAVDFHHFTELFGQFHLEERLIETSPPGARPLVQ